MFSRHVTKQISAYCHGELSSEESKQFAEHIISCVKCRTKFEEVKLGVKLAEQLAQLSAPKHLWSDVEYLLDTPRPAPASSPLWSWPVQVTAAAVLIVVLSFATLWFQGVPSIPRQRVPEIALNPSWQVTRIEGTPKIGTEQISKNGSLGVGEWLETDENSRAQIAVGQIGHVEIDPNTRVRLLTNQPTEHRLQLERGRMSAQIWAPPRLFFVDTPSAVAEDLAPGCVAWWAAGHRSTEPAQQLAIDKLGIVPLLDLGLRLGEGSGAVAAVPLVRSAALLLAEMALLSDLA